MGKGSRHKGHDKVRRSSTATGTRGENSNGPVDLPEQLRGLEPAEQSRMLREMMAEASVVQYDKCVEAMRRLGLVYDPELLYLAHVLQTMVVPKGTASEETHGTSIARCDWVARSLQALDVAGSNPPDGRDIDQMLRLSDDAVMTASMAAGSRASERCEEVELKVLLSGLASEMQTVRGSAYPEQVFSRMQSALGRFDAFFQQELGATVGQLGEALFLIVRAMEAGVSETANREFRNHADAIRASVTGRDADAASATVDDCSPALVTYWEMARALAVRRGDLVGPDGEPLPDAAWEALLKLVGCRLRMADSEPPPEPFLFLPMPMVVLGDGAVVVHDITTALEKLNDRLSERLSANAQLVERWNKTRGAHAEERVFNALERVLGRRNVFRNLTYPDPEKPGGQAEVDVVGVWAGWVVLVEVKAKRHFRFGDFGEVGRLRTDIKNNVHDGFLQALRAKKYLDTGGICKLMERSGENRELTLNGADIQGTLLLSVSLEHLDGVAFQLQAARQLGLFQSGEYPWSISVADLEIVCKHCEGPDVFIHYATKRHDLTNRGLKLITDELGLYGWYLATRFQRPELPERLDVLTLSGYHVQFDEWEEYQRGDRAVGPQIRLEVPGWTRTVLAELRTRSDDAAAQRVALKILDLPAGILEKLESQVPNATGRPIMGTGIQRLELTSRDPAVLVVVGDQPDRQAWAEEVKKRLLVMKHRLKAARALAFGILRWDTRPFSTVTWLEWEWTPDPDMDELAREEPPAVYHDLKQPGRNDPCFCGSGKKFKRCCIDRVAGRR